MTRKLRSIQPATEELEADGRSTHRSPVAVECVDDQRIQRTVELNINDETQMAKELLTQHDPDFRIAAMRVLEKNRELYRRLR